MCLSYIILDLHLFSFFFFFNDTATTEIYTLSLHDALPILAPLLVAMALFAANVSWTRWFTHCCLTVAVFAMAAMRDRKSTRLNSSHQIISYAVFCLKKKKTQSIQGQLKCKTSDMIT